MAYQHRPDLQVEAFKLKAAQLAYRVALGKKGLPQVDVIMEFVELAEAFIEDLDSKKRPKHSHEFKVGMEVTWPIGGNTLKYTYDHDHKYILRYCLQFSYWRGKPDQVECAFARFFGRYGAIFFHD